MFFDIRCESKTGNRPKRYTQDNQDAFFARDDGRWCCLCIADGAGSKKYSALGATWVTHDVSQYLLMNADKLIECEEHLIRSEIIKCIQQSLRKIAKIRNVEYAELSSTMLCVLTDGRICLVLHIGDGVILAERNGYLNVLSFPINGNTRQSTVLTTMVAAEKYLRIKKVSCETISIIWLMTDGAMYSVFQENYGLNGEKLSMPLIRRKLADGNNDDATYGYIKWRDRV